MIYYDIYPTGASIVWLPLFLLLAGVTSIGVGLWFAALNAEYRDIRYLIGFITQFWMYATPVVYPASLLSEPWKTIYGLNPMVGVVEGFRWTLLGKEPARPGRRSAVYRSCADRRRVLFRRRKRRSRCGVGMNKTLAIQIAGWANNTHRRAPGAERTLAETLAILITGPGKSSRSIARRENPIHAASRRFGAQGVTFDVERVRSSGSSGATGRGRARCSRS